MCMRGVRHGWAQEKFDPSSRVRVCGSMSVIVGRRCELGLGLGLGHEEDEEGRHVEGSSMDGALGAPPAATTGR